MTITINGQSYALHFGMKALELFYKNTENVEEGSLFQTDQITAIVWGGLQNGAYRQQKALALSFAAVADWVEEAVFDEEKQAVLAEVVIAFNESQTVKKMAEKMRPAEDKKKGKRRTSTK